jgi:hypothetical protein
LYDLLALQPPNTIKRTVVTKINLLIVVFFIYNQIKLAILRSKCNCYNQRQT